MYIWRHTCSVGDEGELQSTCLVDAMTSGTASNWIGIVNGNRMALTSECISTEFGWKLMLLPGCKLVNKTSVSLMLTILHPVSTESIGKSVSQSLNSQHSNASHQQEYPGQRASGAAKSHENGNISEAISLESEAEYVPVYGIGNSERSGKLARGLKCSSICIWLGKGNGWSNPLPLHSIQRQVIAAHSQY